MASPTETTGAARLDVDNIGGISSTSVAFERGVTVLVGRNATNRTSLLQALMAALGSDRVALKGDADEGGVSLRIGDETYERRFARRETEVASEGDPYLEDSELADLFAFLLEPNEARRAVERGDDLWELVMRPVDTAAINEEIDALVERRREIDDRLEELSALEEDHESLARQRAELTERIETTEADLESASAALEAAEADLDARRSADGELDAKLEELSAARGDLEDVEQSLAAERRSVESLEEELSEFRASLADLPESDGERVEELTAEIERRRDRASTYDSRVSELQTVIQFNEEMLDGEANVVGTLREDGGDGAVTDRLVDREESVVCWTCGSDVSRDEIEGTLDRLRSLRAEALSERNDLRSEIDELTDRRDDLRATLRERERLRERIEAAESELADRFDRIDDLEAERDALRSRVEGLEDEVAERRNDDQSEVLEVHREVNELEFDLDRLREERAETDERIADVEERLSQRADLESERERLADRLADLRTRIDRIEAGAVEEFNDHVDAVLEILGYENLERIWIERTDRETREGRHTVERTVFDLHVIRTSDDGTAYEDTVDHLSESEREVTGLVFALAGYLVHDVHETVPFVLLDSLEAIDSERLPEDARALDDGYHRVTDI
ncbi:chromosome segregation protein SMC [Halobacteriales archaeon QS_5_70_17]|nr:MAG: chromosome segregation protein SMC [Halobacteriales archaeon QS_5_70_17]